MTMIAKLTDENDTNLEAYININDKAIIKVSDADETMVFEFESSEEIDFFIKKLKELKSTYNG